MKKPDAIKKLSTYNSFLKGIARIADPFGTLNERPQSIKRRRIMSDYEALASDWEAVGRDIQTAMGQFEEERQNKR